MPSTGWTTQPKQPINKTIGINKLGTLLSSQTTDTFEYFPKRSVKPDLFVSHFFAAMYLSYSIHFHFANPEFLQEFTL
ncbi:hypothetical protein, partial [Arthrobacter sp. Soil763]|uniref:hypothetical protein n=1 Tax=Arthrobacter sp. Soil763 TaxID=1736402 RepID=UPI001F15D31F